MHVSKKQLPKSQVELTIELAHEELKPFLEQAAKAISTTVKVAGFRPGNAPYDVVAREVGAMRVYEEAAELAVQQSFARAVVQEKLVTVGPPQVSIEKVAPGNPFAFKATVALLPDVTLGDYAGVKVDERAVQVEPAEVDDVISNLRKAYGKEKRILRPVQNGNKVEVDMNGYLDKVPVDGAQAKNQQMVIGEGNFVPGFEENLLGMSEGEEKEFTVRFPKEYHRKDLARRDIEFKVKVKAVYEIELPELNDEFAKSIGNVSTVGELQKRIEESIMREKQDKEKQRWELAVVDAVVKKSAFGEIPDVLIHSEMGKVLHELEHDVANRGMKFDDYLLSIKKSRDDLKKELQPRVIERIKSALVVRAIAEKESIRTTDEELDKEIETHRLAYKDNPEALKQVNTHAYRDHLYGILQNRKVFDLFRNQGRGK
ncbi:MAG: trigger factor [Patescibacteria group bacterium]